MAKRPSRIELLELDIDLRLADLWAEACGVTDWNLEVAAAFLRAAYGKGTATPSPRMRPGHSAGITATESRQRPTAATE